MKLLFKIGQKHIFKRVYEKRNVSGEKTGETGVGNLNLKIEDLYLKYEKMVMSRIIREQIEKAV